ncbi:hypothetical protein [Acetobacterium malicum]|uniref:hypothetical protein n=1 Tax=Acetobacterium malicum TaxID=52692 RepID=UPI0003FB5071|nr:hypothetical protein [Acetobacterium dehalogenans]
MGKAIREIISYTGYTVSLYFLCRYVNDDYGLIYKMLLWIYLTCIVLFFENNGKEVLKEIFKSNLIVIGVFVIDICYGVSYADFMKLFITQIVWQFILVIFVIIYNSSVKLHGKYALKLAKFMSIATFVFLIILQWNEMVSFTIIGVCGLFMGYRYHLFSNAEEREKCRFEQEEEKEQKKKEQIEKERVEKLEKENAKMKVKLDEYKRNEEIVKNKSRRKRKRSLKKRAG